MSKMYGKLPSELLKITDAYTAFCLDEACAYIRSQLDQNKEPTFNREYSSFTDIYSKYTG